MKPRLVLEADLCPSAVAEPDNAGVCEAPPEQPVSNATSATPETLRMNG
jgi:hypothetical protein